MTELLDALTETPQVRIRRQAGISDEEQARIRSIGESGRAAMEAAKRRPSGEEVAAELRLRLAAYRRAKTDLSLSPVPASEIYLLANRARHADFKSLSKQTAAKIEALLAEYDQELATAMPAAQRRPIRRLA